MNKELELMDNYDIGIVIGIKLCSGKYGDCIQNVVYKFSKFCNMNDFDFIMNHSNMPYDEVLDEKLHEYSDYFYSRKGRFFLSAKGEDAYNAFSSKIKNLNNFKNEVEK